MRWPIVFLLNLFVCASFAIGDLSHLKNSIDRLPDQTLKDMSCDIGAVCEYAASQFIQSRLDEKNFYILRNLTYSKKKVSTGELDIIVFSSHTHQAVLLYEVKCRIDEEKAFEKAIGQLRRFKTHVERTLRCPFKPGIEITDGFKIFPTSLFKNTEYRVLMPENSLSHPSPAEHFDLSLEQIYELQEYIKARVEMTN